MTRKKQTIFPLVLQDPSEKAAIEAVARFFRGSQSETLRKAIEVLHEAVNASTPNANQKWLIDEVGDRIKLTWEK